MKKIKSSAVKWFFMVLAVLATFSVSAQQRPPQHKHKTVRTHENKRVVVNHSRYRPTKIVVYHPVWGPRHAFHHRWVFFPRYNFYWDNWRNMYVYRSNNLWVTSVSAPPIVVNVNLESEHQYELREDWDDNDDVYYNNDEHLKVYKEE